MGECIFLHYLATSQDIKEPFCWISYCNGYIVTPSCEPTASKELCVSQATSVRFVYIDKSDYVEIIEQLHEQDIQSAAKNIYTCDCKFLCKYCF